MSKRLALICALTTLCTRPVFAQDMMPVTVQADRVTIGAEFTPRRFDLPNSKIVIAGSPWTPPLDSEWTYIEVQNGALLTCDPTRDTTLRFTTLLVLPGGLLDCSTSHNVNLIVRNVPIDLARDPFQWGNGLVNFGTVNLRGSPKLEWTALSAGALGGTSSITLSEVPTGWRVGDELILPDSAASYFPSLPRRESSVYITSINGQTVGLSKSLDFSHLAVFAPDGRLGVTPIVANVTRNIVIRSENIQGTPGHTAHVGHDARWDMEYLKFIGLGRTTALPLNNTPVDLSRTGTNQVGRYEDHKHHACMMAPSNTCRSIGNVYQGQGLGKWGMATHGTHDTLIQGNIAYDFTGAGFVVEDGYEVRNQFTKNLAMYILSADVGRRNNAPSNVRDLMPGTECTGFWFRGVQQYMDHNQAWDNFVGMNLFSQDTNPGMYPSVPGGPLDTQFIQGRPDIRVVVPKLLEDNTFVGNTIGLDTWALPKYPNVRTTSVNNTQAFSAPLSAGDQFPYLVDPLFVYDGVSLGNGQTIPEGDLYFVPTGIISSGAYVIQFDLEGGYIGGFGTGFHNRPAVNYLHITGTVFQNILDIDLSDGPSYEDVFTNVMFKPYGNHPFRTIHFGDGYVWDGVSPLKPQGVEAYRGARGREHIIHSYNGDGKDYRIFSTQQLNSVPAWPSGLDTSTTFLACPDAGITMGECWDRYGVAYHGIATDDATAIHLPGLVNGVAELGLSLHLGPPRSVITYPTMRAPAQVVISRWDGVTPIIENMFGVLTGDRTGLSDIFRVSIDGGPALDNWPHYRGPQDWWLPNGLGITPGTHEIRTWAVDLAGNSVPSTLMTFHYFVGDTPPNLPVNCVPSAWATSSTDVVVSPWIVVGDHEEQTTTTTDHQTRTIITPAQNGGASCDPLARDVVSTSVATRPIPPSGDLVKPVVTLTVSRSGNSSNYTISASASDDVAVAEATLTINGAQVTTFTSTYSTQVNTHQRGGNTFTVSATDTSGNVSIPVTIIK